MLLITFMQPVAQVDGRSSLPFTSSSSSTVQRGPLLSKSTQARYNHLELEQRLVVSRRALIGYVIDCDTVSALIRASINTGSSAYEFQIVNWIVAFTTPLILARSSFGAYFLFGFSTLFTAVICLLLMPETCSRSLEQIDDAFSGSVSKCIMRSSGIHNPDAAELQWRPAASLHPSGSGDAGHLDSRVIGPARSIRVMPSVDSMRKWLLR